MTGYKESVRLWKHETFRSYISDEKKKYELEQIETTIQNLIKQKDEIQSNTHIYAYNEGNTKSKLKRLLPWKNMKPFVKEFKTKKHDKKTSMSILRFINELLS